MYQILHVPSCSYVKASFNGEITSIEDITKYISSQFCCLFIPSMDDIENVPPVRIFRCFNYDVATDLLCKNIDDFNKNSPTSTVDKRTISLEEFEIVWVE